MHIETKNKRVIAWMMRALGKAGFRIFMGILIQITIVITTNLTVNEHLLSAKLCG